MIGYSKLAQVKWSEPEIKKIEKLFSGSPEDWKKKSLSTVRSKLKEDLLEAQNQRCAYCRRVIVDEIGKIEIDHIIPKSFSPNFTYCRLNLVATCKRCNHRKGEHIPLKQRRKNLVNYPLNQSSYIWVHPYLHDYHAHITIDKNGFFKPVKKSKEGEAVIEKCGLASMHNVLINNRRAISIAAADFGSAILALITQFPQVPSKTLAADLQQRTGKNVPISYLEQEIEEHRNASFTLIKRLRARAFTGPYAKYIK